MAFYVTSLLSGLAFLAAAVPYLRTEGWWVRGFDFPRLQFAGFAAALLLCDLLLLDLARPGNWLIVAAALAALLIQIGWILPYTPLWPREVESAPEKSGDETIAILTVNVLQSNKRADEFLKIACEAQPDILVALEADEWWQQRLDALETDHGYEHTLKRPLDNRYGMLVYSRLPLENAKIQCLVEEDVPSMHVFARLPSGRGVRIHFLHPAPPSPTENEESSERDAELLVVGQSVAKSGVPVVVTGDLNDVAWSATTRLFRKASGLRDPRIGRGMFNTFHAEHWFMRWPLDHLFCSDHFQLARISRLPAFGSDHFPMLMTLACRPQGDAEVRALQADEDDEEWIEEKIDDEGISPRDVHRPERGRESGR